MRVSKIPFGLLNSHCLSQQQHLQPNYTSSPCALMFQQAQADGEEFTLHLPAVVK